MVCTYEDGRYDTQMVRPEDVGARRTGMSDVLLEGDPLEAFAGAVSGRTNTGMVHAVSMNAGAGLAAAGLAGDLKEGFADALEAVESGAAGRLLQKFAKRLRGSGNAGGCFVVAGAPARLCGNSPRVIREDISKTCHPKGGSGTETAAAVWCKGTCETRFSTVMRRAQDPCHMYRGAAAVLVCMDSVPGNGIKFPRDLESYASAYACMVRHGMVRHGNVKGGVRRLVGA